MKLFAVKDILANEFIQVFPHQSVETAKRELSAVVNNKSQSLLYQFPTDYQLFCIGEFETKTGLLTPSLDFECLLADLKKNEV